MKYAGLTAFLPNFEGFPSPRGPCGSTVQRKSTERAPGGSRRPAGCHLRPRTGCPVSAASAVLAHRGPRPGRKGRPAPGPGPAPCAPAPASGRPGPRHRHREPTEIHRCPPVPGRGRHGHEPPPPQPPPPPPPPQPPPDDDPPSAQEENQAPIPPSPLSPPSSPRRRALRPLPARDDRAGARRRDLSRASRTAAARDEALRAGRFDLAQNTTAARPTIAASSAITTPVYAPTALTVPLGPP
jgi:hypothetical protein